MKTRIFIIISFFLFVDVVRAQEGTVIGTSCWPGQYWSLRDNANPYCILRGVVKKVKLYAATGDHVAGCRIYDRDWNVFILPDSGYEGYAINRGGDKNPAPDIDGLPSGLIEMEVRVGHPVGQIERGINLIELFPVGTHVEAAGYWVEDHGHDSKTEFHPLTYLRSLHDGRFVIFSGKDYSGRFPYLQSGNEFVQWDISMPISSSSVSPFQTRTTSVPVEILWEEAIVDQSTIDANSYTWDEYFSRIVATQESGSVRFNASFPSSSSVANVYRGIFTRSQENILTEEITWEKKSTGDGKKYLEAIVKASLGSPANDSLVYVVWSFGAGGGPPLIRQDNPPFNYEYVLRYSPAAGYLRSNWTLGVYGSTKPEGWSPKLPAASNWSIGIVGGPEKRGFMQQIRNYKINPSNIELSQEGIFTSIPSRSRSFFCSAGREESSQRCQSGWKISRHEKLAIGAEVTSLNWYVQILSDECGNPITEPPTLVTPDAPLNKMGVNALISGSNDLSISFGGQCSSELEPISVSGGNLTRIGSPPLATARVIVGGQTDLGELLYAESDNLRGFGCFQSDFFCSPEEFIIDVLKGVRAISMLRERGLIKDPPIPSKWDPRSWDNTILDMIGWDIDTGIKGHLYEWCEGSNHCDILRNLSILLQTGKSAPNDLARLILAAKLGAAIPSKSTWMPSFSELSRLVALPDPPFVGKPVPSDKPREFGRFDVLESSGRIVIWEITFSGKSSNLDEGSMTELDKLAKDLQARPESAIKIGVHCFHSNSPKSNLVLSQKRASEIRRYLISKGIDGARLSMQGYGDSKPLVTEKTTKGRIKNTRIEIEKVR